MQRIDIRIAYEPGRKLARAYNRVMEEAVAEWVLILDWDLFNCNPYWYDCCVSAIDQVGDRAGWITCVTNRIGSNSQRASRFMPNDEQPPLDNNIENHVLYARKMHRIFNTMDKDGRLVKADVKRIPGALSGFFILTSKTAWKACGGFDENRKRLLGVDNKYSQALSQAGYQLFLIPGLYFYHIYRQKSRLWRGNAR
jgi:GT2 family glycosyltransferase